MSHKYVNCYWSRSHTERVDTRRRDTVVVSDLYKLHRNALFHLDKCYTKDPSICCHHCLIPETSHHDISTGSSNHHCCPVLLSLAYFFRLPPSNLWFFTPVSRTALPTAGLNVSGSKNTVKCTCFAVEGSTSRAVRCLYGGKYDASTGDNDETMARTLHVQF